MNAITRQRVAMTTEEARSLLDRYRAHEEPTVGIGSAWVKGRPGEADFLFNMFLLLGFKPFDPAEDEFNYPGWDLQLVDNTDSRRCIYAVKKATQIPYFYASPIIDQLSGCGSFG